MLLLSQKCQESLHWHGFCKIIIIVSELYPRILLENTFELITTTWYFVIIVNLLVSQESFKVGASPFPAQNESHGILSELFEIPRNIFWNFNDISCLSTPHHIVLDVFNDWFLEYFAEKWWIISHDSIVTDVVVENLIHFMRLLNRIEPLENHRKFLFEIGQNEIVLHVALYF